MSTMQTSGPAPKKRQTASGRSALPRVQTTSGRSTAPRMQTSGRSVPSSRMRTDKPVPVVAPPRPSVETTKRSREVNDDDFEPKEKRVAREMNRIRRTDGAITIARNKTLLVDMHDSSSSQLSLLPGDVRLHMLQFLSTEELHENYALVSKLTLYDSRNDKIFDQTQTVTISCGDSIIKMLKRIQWLHRHGILDSTTRSRSTNKLKLTQHENLHKVTMGNLELKSLLITGGGDQVRTLDMSFLDDKKEVVQNCVPKILSSMLQNLHKVDMSNIICRHTTAADFSTRHNNTLQKFHWNGASGGFSFSGQDLRHCKVLKELYLDDACLYSPESNCFKEALFKNCSSKLERVSIKNLKYKMFGQRSPRKVPLQMIVQFVLSTPTLQWIRSDLTADRIAELKEKRPNVTFAN